MSTLGLDTIRVPLASNTPPYRIDEVGEHDCYVRIRRPGPDLLALVPPGDCATGFRTRLISELQAHASRQIATRRLDGLLIALLFVAIPLLLVSACIAAAAGITPFPAGSVLARSTPIVMLALLLGYVVVMLIPRHGLVDQVTSVPYPRDPEDALGEMEESGIRYLREDDLRGDTAMEALRHDVLARPGSVNPEEWAALWALAARDELYASALVSVRDLARLRLAEATRSGARGFSAQMQVAIEGFESALTQPPPTSSGEEYTDTEEASWARAGRSASATPARRATRASSGPSLAERPT